MSRIDKPSEPSTKFSSRDFVTSLAPIIKYDTDFRYDASRVSSLINS